MKGYEAKSIEGGVSLCKSPVAVESTPSERLRKNKSDKIIQNRLGTEVQEVDSSSCEATMVAQVFI